MAALCVVKQETKYHVKTLIFLSIILMNKKIKNYLLLAIALLLILNIIIYVNRIT